MIINLNRNPSDSELMGDAMLDLNNAVESFGQLKHPLGETLLHMVHSIQVYIEKYLLDENEGKDIYKLPKPTMDHIKEME